MTSMLEPSEQPHPLLWGMAVTPSTLGYFALSKSVNSATVAICTASCAAHMLVGTIRIQLRMPTRPSGRR